MANFRLSLRPAIMSALVASALIAQPCAVSAKAKPPAPAPAPTPTPTPTPSALPATVGVCALSDLTSATACSGFFQGNLNSNNSGDIAAQTAALATIGFAWDGNFNNVEKINLSNTSFDIDFATMLTDTSFVSIHWGAGQGPVKTQGGTTGFYRIESNSPLNILVSAFGSLSNAVLYKTAVPIPDGGGGGGGVGGDVGGGLDTLPEPGVWLQMIAGFGLVGAVRRRRQRPIAA